METIKFPRLKTLLDTNDVSIIKVTSENFMLNEMPDEIVSYFAEKLSLSDNGIRDTVSNTLITNTNPHIPELVIQYISSDDSTTRNLAGEILLKKNDSSISAISNYLKNCTEEDQKFLIDILGLIGSQKASNDILQILISSKDDNVILACIEALGNIKEKQAVNNIIKFYNKNELYQPSIIEALGKIGSEAAVEFILKIHESADDLTKFSIMESLGEIGDLKALQFIKEELKKIRGPLAWVALESLVELSKKYGKEIEYNEYLNDIILTILLEAENKYKLAVLNLTDAFSDRKILKAAIQYFGQDEQYDYAVLPILFNNADLFFNIISEDLADFKSNKKIILLFAKELVTKDSGESFNKLSESKKHNFANGVAFYLNDPDEEVRIHSIELLFYLTPEAALLFLDTMIEDPSVWNKLRLLDIIKSSSDFKVLESIKKLSNDNDEMVKQTAEEILLDMGITD